MKAILRNYRQSPRKVRVVADSIRGKNVEEALLALSVLPRRASEALAKAVSSAAANAKENEGKNPGELYIKEIRVDGGLVMGRWMPRAYGRATPINKRTSHIVVVLSEQPGKKADAAPKTEKAPAKKSAPKTAKKTVSKEKETVKSA